MPPAELPDHPMGSMGDDEVDEPTTATPAAERTEERTAPDSGVASATGNFDLNLAHPTTSPATPPPTAAKRKNPPTLPPFKPFSLSSSPSSSGSASDAADQSPPNEPDEEEKGASSEIGTPSQSLWAAMASVVGYNRNGRTSTSGSNNTRNQPHKADSGVAAVQRIVDAALYELKVDPYRGALGTRATSSELGPWDGCQVGSLERELNRRGSLNFDLDASDDDSNNNDNEPAATERVALSSCPCLQQPTRSKKGASTSRKGGSSSSGVRTGLGRVFAGRSYQCDLAANDYPVPWGCWRCGDSPSLPCDYNPLCLLSLGSGVVFDALYDAAQQHPPPSQSDQDPDSTSFVEYRDDDRNQQPWRQLLRQPGDPFDPNELDPAHPLCLYRPETLRQLGQIRTYLEVDEARLRRHLRRTLRTTGTTAKATASTIAATTTTTTAPITVADALHVICAHHRLLAFENPLEGVGGGNYIQETQSHSHTGSVEAGIDILSLERSSDEHDEDEGDTVRDGDSMSATRNVRLALPPGIENLGCTCYLNTQLQCLAQCLAFCHGIFSWRPPASNASPAGATATQDRMQNVLLLFQRLLAELRLGGSRAINTLDFSNALGLDHHEQQDPNEFSRLFLERMDETLRATSGIAASTDSKVHDGDNLTTLLSHLFQGQMRYETICQHCHSTTERHEDFRDLNLPIEDCGSGGGIGSKPKKPGQLSMLSFLTSSEPEDLSVQQCLDAYCQPEHLQDDNRYWCDACQAKRDATRQVSFARLPPVLNVQLCRYVYDRASGSKKKRSDPVRLPLELRVTIRPDPVGVVPGSSTATKKNAPKSESRASEENRRYRLCAVMRHQGNSAYHGHYVAEALDWVTGQWFEFNDEKVTHLPLGPSCSFLPEQPRESDRTKRNRRTLASTKAAAVSNAGSKDAYNMYYVEEGFFARTVEENLQSELLPPLRSTASITGSESAVGVLDRIAAERAVAYADLQSMCLQDGADRRKIVNQRVYLRAKAIPDVMALVPTEPVWVSREPLRQMLNLDFSEPITPRTSLLCSHSRPGLHPRTARRGKLISKELFQVLRDKSAAWYNDTTMDVGFLANQERQGVLIEPSKNLVCTACSVEYRKELRKKLERLSQLKDLYDLLDTKVHPEVALQLKDGERPEWENEQYLFVVSRSFVTRFNRRFSALAKFLTTDSAGTPATTFSIDVESESIAEGLDALAWSSLCFDDMVGDLVKDDDVIDPTVNDSLTCKLRQCLSNCVLRSLNLPFVVSGPHGCFTANNKRLFRYVPHATWEVVQSLFPRAFQIRHKRYSWRLLLPDFEAICPECEAEGHAEDMLVQRVRSLVAYSGDTDMASLDMSTIVNRELALSSAPSPRKYRVVHADDLAAWRKFSKAFGRNGRIPKYPALADAIRSLLSPKALPCTRRLYVSGKDVDSTPLCRMKLEMLSSFLRPIVCSKHGKPIHQAFFGSNAPNEVKIEGRELTGPLALLEESKYSELLTSLATLVVMLTPSDDDVDSTFADDSRNAEDFLARFDLRRCLHPVILGRFDFSSDACANSTVFSTSTESVGMQFELIPAACTDPECNGFFVAWQDAESVQTGRSRPSKPPPVSTRDSSSLMSVDSDVEMVTDSAMPLRIFELEVGASVASELPNLAQCAGVALDDSILADQGLRRSRRKRKTIFPIGAVVSEDAVHTSLDKNLAALRLILLEGCTTGLPYELNHSLTLLLSSPKASQTTTLNLDETDDDELNGPFSMRVVELPFDANSKSLREIGEEALDQKLPSDWIANEHLFLVRQAEVDVTSLEFQQDELMESLIGISNCICSTGSSDKGKPSRNKATKAPERGFTGTLLSGAPKPSSTAMDVGTESQPSSSSSGAAAPVAPVRALAARAVDGSSVSNNAGSSRAGDGPNPTAKRARTFSPVAAADSSDDEDVVEVKSPLLVHCDDRKKGAPMMVRQAKGQDSSEAANGSPSKSVLDLLDDSGGEDDDAVLQPTIFSRSDSSLADRTSLPSSRRPRRWPNNGTYEGSPPTEDEPDPDVRIFRLAVRLRELSDGTPSAAQPPLQLSRRPFSSPSGSFSNDDRESQRVEAARWTVECNPTEQRLDKLESVAVWKFAELTGLYG